jgi:hypothetical protein
MAALRGLYRYYMSRPLHLTDPFDCQLYTAAMADLSASERTDELARALADIRRPGDPAAASQAATALQRALIDWDLVDPEVAIMITMRLPGLATVEPAIAALAADWLERAAKKPDRRLLDMIANLGKHGWKPGTPRLAKLASSDKDVRDFTERARGPRILNSERYLKETVQLVADSDRSVVRIRIGDILAACLASQDPYLGGTVMTALRSDLAELMVDGWASGLTQASQVGHAVWAVHCLAHPKLPGKCHDLMASDMRKYRAALGRKDGERWRTDVQQRLDPGLHEIWESVFAPKSGLRWISRDGG